MTLFQPSAAPAGEHRRRLSFRFGRLLGTDKLKQLLVSRHDLLVSGSAEHSRGHHQRQLVWILRDVVALSPGFFSPKGGSWAGYMVGLLLQHKGQM